MTATKVIKSSIKFVHSLVNYFIIVIILFLIAFAGYALWDSNQVYQSASKSQYALYKPSVENEGKSFKELQGINDEVIAWLTVFGTNIDYPVTQSTNNMKYVNTNAEGAYSLSGAIFLDSSNSKDFTDFNSIFFGHHMEKRTMFGEIDLFRDAEKFDSHRYGNLYFNEQDHGIEFFAFVHADAYDREIFAANVQGKEAQEQYLRYILDNATHTRDIGITINDRIVLLSTCSSSSTNGRDILIGRLTGNTYEDTFANMSVDNSLQIKNTADSNFFVKQTKIWLPALIILLFLIILIVWLLLKRKKAR